MAAETIGKFENTDSTPTPSNLTSSLPETHTQETEKFFDGYTHRRSFLAPGHSLTPSPWDFLPVGGFSIEDGTIVSCREEDTEITTRAREDMAASEVGDRLIFSSEQRQRAAQRLHSNTRQKSGHKRQRGGKPQPSRTHFR